jgi:pimeloyl-ACP methyl ester carboxylesterase
MRRWEIALAIAGAILLGVSAWVIRRTELPRHDFILSEAGCHMPVTVIEPVLPNVKGSAVVFHGLTANRRIMQNLATYLAAEAALRVYLVDLPGHGGNEDPFSFPRAEQCAAAAVESLTRSGRIDPTKTVLVGHSMGGAIAIRMADRDPTAATIAISPAPMIMPRRMPSNLLVFSAQFDLGVLRREARAMEQAAGGDRATKDDFVQARAFLLEQVSPANHTSVLFDPRVLEQSAQWVRKAIDGSPAPTSDGVVFDMRGPQPSSAAAFVGLAALLMLLPAAITVAAKGTGPAQPEISRARVRPALVLAEGAACAVAAVLILALGVPLRFFRLYAGDYLASVLLIVGALLLALNWTAARESCSSRARALVVAGVLGLAMMLGFGAWLNWQLTEMWLNGPRWLRFAGLLPIALIYCFAEEAVLGPIGDGKRRALRFGVFLSLRLELWLACLLAYYTLASGQVLILILVTFLAAFSILQRLATDALLRRTGSATGATFFGAILTAWFIAAVFPLT